MSPTSSHQEQPCLPLCCPHGRALVIDEQSGEEVCNDQKPRRVDQVVGYNQEDAKTMMVMASVMMVVVMMMMHLTTSRSQRHWHYHFI